MMGLFVVALFLAFVIGFVWFKMPEHRGIITAAATAVGAAFGAAWQWIAGLFGG